MLSPADLRRSPALLKLDLYCRGMRLDESCFVEGDGGRQIMRTRAGLGSGLELVLPGGLWTNVPVTETFARASPYLLRRDAGRYRLTRDGDDIAPVRLSPRPEWYDRRTTSGRPMTRVGTLQGTYLGIYPAQVCDFWLARPQKINCHFCSVGLNLGVDDATDKSVEEVAEVVRAARQTSGVTYVDFNTAGLEPPSSSIRAIDWMTSVGAIPTVCVFRPLRGTDYEGLPPPRTEDLVPVFRRLYESCMERGLPIGCAPNVHVSLVLLPEECASLSPRSYPWQRAKLALMKRAFSARLHAHLRAA